MRISFLTYFTLFFWVLFLGQTSRAQKPQGRFLTDTIEIGSPFQYVLSLRHAPQKDVFFPDANAQFGTFTFIKQDIFNTQTDARGSLDSTIYTLVSFDDSPAQSLSLPVYILTETDCTAVFTQPDTVKLRSFLAVQGRDSLRLQANDFVLPLKQQLNIPLILLFVTSVFTAFLLIYTLFRKRIRRLWQWYKLFASQRDFNRAFNRLVKNLQGKNGMESAENSVILWKKYLERLEKLPFTTYTTREISDNFADNQALADALREIDGVIYGGTDPQQAARPLDTLRTLALQRYQLRQAEIKNTPQV